MESIVYDERGLIISIIVIFVFILKVFFDKKLVLPFVIPQNSNLKVLNWTKKVIFLVIGVLIIILPLNIGYKANSYIKKEKTLNVEILFDVSLSMTAKDLQPDRFEAAKKAVIKFISNLEDYNIGVIIFSGIPVVYSPISSDTKALVSKIDNMKMSDFPPTIDFVGTAIGDAIMLGIGELEKLNQSKQPGVIVLVTDGDSNRGLDPIKASQFAKQKNIPIYTLGIGKENYLIGYDHWGNPVNTSINVESLKKISSITNGEFKRVLKNSDFSDIFDKISRYVKNFERKKIIIEYNYINYYLLIVLIVLVSIYLVIIVV